MTAQHAEPDLAALYRETRERLSALVSGLGDAALAARVPACPAWSVRDVVAHLAAVAQDVTAGRLTGAPSADDTAAQVARFRGTPVPGVLAAWADAAPGFEEIIGAFSVWPAVG